MSNTNDLHVLDEGLRRPIRGDPLQESVMAAIFGSRFNDELWEVNARAIQNLCWSPCSAGGNSCTIPRVEPEDGADYPSDNAELTPRPPRKGVSFSGKRPMALPNHWRGDPCD